MGLQGKSSALNGLKAAGAGVPSLDQKLDVAVVVKTIVVDPILVLVGEFAHFRTYFSGYWDVQWGVRAFDPWPCHRLGTRWLD